MLRLEIKIDMDNAAFDGDWEYEAGIILSTLARFIDHHGIGGDGHDLIDSNGNTVGKAEVIDD